MEDLYRKESRANAVVAACFAAASLLYVASAIMYSAWWWTLAALFCATAIIAGAQARRYRHWAEDREEQKASDPQGVITDVRVDESGVYFEGYFEKPENIEPFID